MKLEYIVKNLKLVVNKDIKHISEAYDESIEIIKKHKTGEKNGYLLRWNKLNKALGGCLQFGTILTIGARPSVGKSALANLIAFDLFELNDIPTILLYWTWEMPSWQQIHRRLSEKIRISFNNLQSTEVPLDDETFLHIVKLKEDHQDYNIFFIDVSKNLEDVWAIIKHVYTTFPNHKLVNIFDHTRLSTKKGEKTEEEKIYNLMAICNSSSKIFNTTNIVLSQLNRDVEKNNISDERSYRTPQNSDLFGASAVEQFSTVIFLLHRPELAKLENYTIAKDKIGNPITKDTKGLFIIEVSKNRNGTTGTLFFKHELKFNNFIEIDPIEETNKKYGTK